MPFESALFYGMFNNLAIFIVMVFVYGLFLSSQHRLRAINRRILLGLSFGMFAYISMHAHIPAAEGVIVDQRNAIAALSGAFGGPLSAAITATIAGAYRIHLGGAGALGGTIGICLGALAGVGLFFLRVPSRGPAWVAAGALGATIFILPGFLFLGSLAAGLALLKTVALPYGTAIFLGIFLGTLLLSREQQRLDAEAALKASEDRFRAFAESASDWFWETDADHRPTFVTAGGDARTTLNFEEEGDDPDEAEDRRRLRERLDTHGDFRGLLLRYRRNGREPRILSITGKPLLGHKGAFLGYRGTATDVTDQVQADLRLREREERYRSVLATAQDGFMVLDEDGHLLQVNDAYVNRSGYSRDELLSMNISELSTDDVPARMARLKVEGRAFFTSQHRAKDGEVWDVEVSVTYVDAEGGRLFSFLRDISERKSMERQLVQAQKMEVVGQLSGGIAHDFNNLLSVMSINAGLLRQTVDNATARKCADAILASVKRGAQLTRKLLVFSRTETVDAKRVSVNDFIHGMEGLLARSLTPAIRVETALAKDLWPVDINPGDLEDSILNLALNARDAMPEGGTLVIETANKVIDENYVQRNPGAHAGDFVMIAVSDTGAGIPGDVLDKVFEPFFTTKDQTKGTGLGLSMVYGFVKRSGGHAKIYSELGEGTTVRLYLPRARGAAAVIDLGREAPAEPPRGSETVLIVDDEEALLHSAATILESLGYTALTAADARHALAVLDRRGDIDLLFSDVIMPGGMDGYRLAIAAVKRRPDLKVLLTTGFTRKRETFANGDSRIAAELTQTVLNKPYNAMELAIAVRRAVDG